MGYVSFREGMFFLNALGFLTKDLRGIECQNDVPNKGFQHHHPRLGVTKCWFCPWVFIDDGSRWACFRAQNTSILKYWNWFFVKFLTIKTSKHVHSYFHQSQTSQNCLVFLVFVLSDVCFVFYHGIHHHYNLGIFSNHPTSKSKVRLGTGTLNNHCFMVVSTGWWTKSLVAKELFHNLHPFQTGFQAGLNIGTQPPQANLSFWASLPFSHQETRSLCGKVGGGATWRRGSTEHQGSKRNPFFAK